MPATRYVMLLAAVAACESATARDTSNRFDHAAMVRYHMQQHYDLSRAIELLLVQGKLDDAKAFARLIAEAPNESALGAFRNQAAAVRERAVAVAEAPNGDEACRRVARLGAACASCHADAGVLPQFGHPAQPPEDAATVPARMARHLWAADRLWEGVVGRSDESWRAGMDVLAATPLPWSVVDADREALWHGLQKTALDARDAPASDRPRQYGEILVQCTACHAARSKKD